MCSSDLAAHAPRVTGARALLLPSDERTRGWFRAMGRDADWRRLEGPDAGFDEDLMLDLAHVRPERATGTRVRLGPFVDDEDVFGLARALAARERALLLPLEVVVPGRLELGLWSDALETLRTVGAQLLDRADPQVASVSPDLLVVGGEPGLGLEQERGVWTAAEIGRAHV